MHDVFAVNIPEAARRLGLSARTVATLVSRGHLMSRKVGRRRIIPVLALEAFLRMNHESDGFGLVTGPEGKHSSSG